MLTDFRNSFAGTLKGKFATNSYVRLHKDFAPHAGRPQFRSWLDCSPLMAASEHHTHSSSTLQQLAVQFDASLVR